jgi:hypothetical protein
MPLKQPAAAGGALPRGGRIEVMRRNGKDWEGIFEGGENIYSKPSLPESSFQCIF